MTSFYIQFKEDGRTRTRHLGKEATLNGRQAFTFQGERFESWQEWKEYLETSDIGIIDANERPVETDELIALVEASNKESGRKYYKDLMGLEYDPDNKNPNTDESTWLDSEGYLFYSGMFF